MNRIGQFQKIVPCIIIYVKICKTFLLNLSLTFYKAQASVSRNDVTEYNIICWLIKSVSLEQLLLIP